MQYGNENITVAEFTGRCKGRLNFSILISWILTDGEFKVGDEFELPFFDYFQRFEVNSEFNYHDTCDPKAIYRLRMLRLDGDTAALRIQQIFREDGDMWLYDNSITYGTDYGIIEFIRVYKKPNLKLINCQSVKG